MEKPSEGYVLSEDIFKTLKCSFCNLYLSYPPVFMTTFDDVKYKCARCTIKTRFSFRDLMYENLAKHMKFPCIYEDCTEILGWDNVREHEKICDYRSLQCLTSDCQDVVLEGNFVSHFKEKHKKLYYHEKITIESLRSNYGFCVLEKDEQCYILFYDIEGDKLRMCLTRLGSEKLDKQFEVKFHGKDDKTVVITEQNLVQFNERAHCYKCIKGDCKRAFHNYVDYRRGVLNYTYTKIDRYLLKRTFGSDIGCIVNVVDEKVETEDELDDLLLGGKDVVIDEISEEDDAEKPIEPPQTDAIKDLLKCPGCQEPLKEPIFQCLKGHAICKECKSKAQTCLVCDTKIDNTRNYIVEEVISNLKLYKEDEPIQVEEKEIVCPMSKCKDSVKLSAISNHFKDSHIEHFHFNKVTLNKANGYNNVDALVKDGKTYLLFSDFNEFYLGISVCSLVATDQLFEVKLLSDNKKYAMIATEQKVIKFNDLEHCFKCSRGICKITEHTYRTNRKEIFRRLTTKFDRELMKRAFKSFSMSYQITIQEPKQIKSDAVLKPLFECPICKDYMVPPIHQCVAGHTLCNVCKTKVDKCPSCEGSIEETRNFILENISEVVELPCSFESESCDFRAGVKRVASHESECPLNNKKPRVEDNAKDKEDTNKEKVEMEEAPPQVTEEVAE